MAEIDYTKGQIYRNGVYYGGDGSGSGLSADIVDNLLSTDPEKALSANQGRILDEKKLDKPIGEYKIMGTDGNGDLKSYNLSYVVEFNFVVRNNSRTRMCFRYLRHYGIPPKPVDIHASTEDLWNWMYREDHHSTSYSPLPVCGNYPYKDGNLHNVMGLYASTDTGYPPEYGGKPCFYGVTTTMISGSTLIVTIPFEEVEWRNSYAIGHLIEE